MILVAMEIILVRNYVLPQLPKYYIIKWAGAACIQGAHNCVSNYELLLITLRVQAEHRRLVN